MQSSFSVICSALSSSYLDKLPLPQLGTGNRLNLEIPCIMTVRTTSLRQRMSDRRLSFVFSRRSSSSVSGDVSTSYHHRGDSTRSGNSAGRRLSRRDSSLSEASTAASVDHPTRADAVTAADEKKSSFRESLPESLLAAHDYRDCIAPFRRDEVRDIGRLILFY